MINFLQFSIENIHIFLAIGENHERQSSPFFFLLLVVVEDDKVDQMTPQKIS